MSELHIIAACADRKALAPSAALRMRTLRQKTLDRRIAEWTRRLRSDGGTRVAAQDLYVGEYWSIVKGLPVIARQRGIAATLWVASAGYGLVQASARIHSYAATFTARHPDSVVLPDAQRRTVGRTWWQQLTAARVAGPYSSAIGTLARKHPKAHLLIIGSPTYISAMHDDLTSAADEGVTLTIITSPNGLLPVLVPFTLYTTARWQAALGGTLLSLHARVARELLQRDLDVASLRRSLAQRQEAPARIARTTMADDAVKAFIKKSTARTYSTALRELRNAGYACEQSRFRRLFFSTRQR